jgi:anti-sigma factor RsiW
MLCSDLDRYLEIHLDGRLGRSRTAVLRRHLAACGSCRTRVELLRRFERDLARQLGGSGGGTRGEHGSVWQGLDADLVRTVPAGGGETGPLLRALPPPGGAGSGAPGRPLAARGAARPSGREPSQARGGGNGNRRIASKLAGLLAVTLALGTLYELALSWLRPRDAAEAAIEAYLNVVAGGPGLTLRTDDPAKLQEWLKDQLGPASPVPPVPEGFRVVGGARADVAGRPAAVVVYAPTDDPAETRPTLLFLQADDTPAEVTAEPVVARDIGDYHQLAWDMEPFALRVVGTGSPERLRGFAP